MKTLMLITMGLFVVTTALAEPRDHLRSLSETTGVPPATLAAQRAATGFGYGELETANLLANATGQSFEAIAARRQAGEGWGKIAQDYGFKLGELKSAAHRSDNATLHARHGDFRDDRLGRRGDERPDRDAERGPGRGKGGHKGPKFGKGKPH